jgi:hypothetical protein
LNVSLQHNPNLFLSQLIGIRQGFRSRQVAFKALELLNFIKGQVEKLDNAINLGSNERFKLGTTL